MYIYVTGSRVEGSSVTAASRPPGYSPGIWTVAKYSLLLPIKVVCLGDVPDCGYASHMHAYLGSVQYKSSSRRHLWGSLV